MNKKTVTFFCKCIQAIGLDYDSPHPTRTLIGVFVLICAQTQFLVCAFQNSDRLINVIFPLCYLFLMVLTFIDLIAFAYRTKDIHLLLKYMDQNMYTYSDEERIKPLYHWLEGDENLLRVIIYVWWFGVFICACIVISPLVQLLFIGKVVIFMYPGWIPWKIDTPIPFVCAFIIQTNIFIVGCIIISLTTTFPLCVMIEFQRQSKRLCVALRTITDRAKESTLNEIKISSFIGGYSYHLHISGERYKTNYNRRLKINIISCIRHYQMLFK